jgi:predicted nucleotidyltransferase
VVDFIQLLNRLSDYQVEYVLVGGLAAATYGSSLVTQDVDVCVNLELANLIRLKKAVIDLNPVHRLTPNCLKFDPSESELSCVKNLYLQTDLGALDCLGQIKGLGEFKDVEARAENIQLEGLTVRILSLEALIEAKRAMGRPKDQETVRQLKWIQKSPPENR